MNFSIENADGWTIDRACVGKVVEKLCELVDMGRLDPVRTEIFAGSPMVLEMKKQPYVSVQHRALNVLVGIRDGSDIITIDEKRRYALFRLASKDSLQWTGCVSK